MTEQSPVAPRSGDVQVTGIEKRLAIAEHALRVIGNEAGRPTMEYAIRISKRIQREALDNISQIVQNAFNEMKGVT